ncbi:exosome complex protein Rrp4 [Candidatus Woesearchaeota archaeon]|nr:exosome complex protein Rrp4 [Candidatus Woesearchaeota archaeon]
MSKLITKDKEVVVPGEVLAEGMDYLPGIGTYRDGEKILASKLGLTNIDGRAIKLIPLSGRYMPKRGDTIIAEVTEVAMSAWRVDTNSAYTAMLGMRDATSEFIPKGANLRKYFDFGEYIVCKITNVTSQKLIDITMKGPGLRKLRGGRIIRVNCNKVPRIIGKKGSMVSMIKNATASRIIVGQNGVIWLEAEDPKMELLAVETIYKIEKEAHIAGLTDRIKEHLEKETGKKIEIIEAAAPAVGGEQ